MKLKRPPKQTPLLGTWYELVHTEDEEFAHTVNEDAVSSTAIYSQVIASRKDIDSLRVLKESYNST